ncbi:MAG: COG4315 family predicted lipoprotein [Euzebya sp.]
MLALLLLATLAACGIEGAPTAEAPSTTRTASTSSTSSATTPAVADPVVAVGTTDLGEVLVDGGGLTLYAFTNDSSGTSSCTDGCEETWPPLLVDSAAVVVVGDQLDVSAFTTTQRPDGATQVVIDQSPLYHFAADSSPGDVNGQGVGGTWFVVNPAGQLVQDDPTELGGGSQGQAGPGGYDY